MKSSSNSEIVSQNKKLLIIGGEGHGSVIASCIYDNQIHERDCDLEICGYVNDFVENIDGLPVLGGTNDIEKLVAEGYYFAWGIHLIGRNPLTVATFERMRIPLDRLVTIVHYTAFIGRDVVLNPGVLVMPHAYIAPRTTIGTGTMIKSNVCIGHDVKCGELCHFAMGSITGSYVTMGLCSDVAIGSIVLEKRKIGDFAIAGASSLVTHDIPDYEIHVGQPAKFLRRTQST